MKKATLTIVAFLMAVLPAFSESVSVQTAQRAAQSFLNSKMEGNPQIHLIDFAEKASFPNFYVFGNEHCFVIIAADDCVHPVLGYSTESGFGTEIMPDCVSDWLKAYNDGIAAAKKRRLDATAEIRFEWERLLNGSSLEPKSRSFVKPLIHTKWSQSAPFNNLCPPDTANHATGHAVAGCGAIAMAQIMNYWEHPIRGIGSHSYNHSTYGTLFANFGETIYDWDNMKNLYTRGYSDAEALAVATLVYHCGVSINMGYGPSSSNAGEPILDSAMRYYFDYSSSTNYVFKSQYSNIQWISMLKNDLDNLQPVLYRAASNSQGANAHIFICDGYDENDFFHFNWGHAGNYDGYYTIAELHEGITNYNYANAAMFGCHPNTPSINPPVNIYTSVNEQIVNVSWSFVNNAAYYKLYRDGDLVNGHITGVSYTESNVPFGPHTYYLKSVKADGTMSLRSNAVDVDVSFPGPQPTNLQASVNGHDVSMSWQTESPESAILQYGTGSCIGGVGTNTEGTKTSWAQCFPASMLQEYTGMAIEKVDFYVRTGKYGEYTVGIYKEVEMDVIELVYQQSYNATAAGWQEIVFPSPITIDYTHDLWIVFSSYVYKPASICSMSNHYDALLYSYDQSGVLYWQHRAENWSWMIKTYLTDGTYTYNLYRNGNVLATNLTDNTYTDSNLPDGIYHYHVTTNYFGGESDPSNTVNVQVGTPSLQTIDFVQGVNWFSTNVEITLNDLKAALLTALPETAITIKSKTQSAKYVVRTHSWNGTLDWDIMQMYKILVPSACEITLVGLPINPAEYPVTITNGSNWIGYPLAESMTVTAALADFGALNGEVIKSKTGSARYWNGSWRSNGLDIFEPGRGYVYQSSTSSDRTLIYPSAK